MEAVRERSIRSILSEILDVLSRPLEPGEVIGSLDISDEAMDGVPSEDGRRFVGIGRGKLSSEIITVKLAGDGSCVRHRYFHVARSDGELAVLGPTCYVEHYPDGTSKFFDAAGIEFVP